MEVFSALEAKVILLVADFKKIKEENKELKEQCVFLEKENAQFKSHIEQIENSLLSKDLHTEELSQQKELTEMVLVDLMKSLDFLDAVEPKVVCER